MVIKWLYQPFIAVFVPVFAGCPKFFPGSKRTSSKHYDMLLFTEKIRCFMDTEIIIDNATLAAAGRATYCDAIDDTCFEAKTHIQQYKKSYPTSSSNDITSLSELISALILYDVLKWNRGSKVSESREQSTGNLPNELCWVYKWFPVYLHAYDRTMC